MNTTKFIEFCKSLSNDDLADVNPAILHAIIGIGSESGELQDALKKALVYHAPLDFDNVKEELGDLLHYIARLIDTCGWSFEGVLDANVQKLRKRYPNGYSHQAGLERADKQETKPIDRTKPVPGGY